MLCPMMNIIAVLRRLKSKTYEIINYYTYINFIGIFCISQKELSETDTIAYFLIYHILLGIISVIYIRIRSSDGISTMDLFPKERLEVEELVNGNNCNPFFLEDLIDKANQNLNICRICYTFKPPRSHHCSICNKCYLKFDHHCGLLDTCIVFQKYKFFYQFLLFNSIFTLFVITVFVLNIREFMKRTILYFVNYAINVTILCIVFLYAIIYLGFHTFLIINNETTVEFKALNCYIVGDNTRNQVFQEGPITQNCNTKKRKYLNPYNISMKKNWKEVFGDRWFYLFSPFFTSKGNGVSFPKNSIDGFDI